VLQRADATLLFYTVRQASTGRQCLTVASGSGPGGPFLDGSSGPLECGDDHPPERHHPDDHERTHLCERQADRQCDEEEDLERKA